MHLRNAGLPRGIYHALRGRHVFAHVVLFEKNFLGYEILLGHVAVGAGGGGEEFDWGMWGFGCGFLDAHAKLMHLQGAKAE